MDQEEIRIRKGHSGDIDQLIDLQREGFPEEIFYQVPRKYCRRWWEYLLTSNVAEVFVAEVGERIVGASVLVIELDEFYEAKGRFKVSFPIRLTTLLTKPNVTLAYFKKILKSHGFLKPPITHIKIHPDIEGEFSLLDTAVVAKEYRRRGILKRLRKRCEERTIELNRPVLLTMVDPSNTAPLKANFEVFKSVCVGKSKSGMLFLKKHLIPKNGEEISKR